MSKSDQLVVVNVLNVYAIAAFHGFTEISCRDCKCFGRYDGSFDGFSRFLASTYPVRLQTFQH